MRCILKPSKHGEEHSSHMKHKQHSPHAVAEKAEHCIRSVLESPPHTWEAYHDMPGGLWKIVEMEYGEAMAAYKAMKAETGTHTEFVKQIGHVLAATAAAYDKMTCEEHHHDGLY